MERRDCRSAWTGFHSAWPSSRLACPPGLHTVGFSLLASFLPFPPSHSPVLASPLARAPGGGGFQCVWRTSRAEVCPLSSAKRPPWETTLQRRRVPVTQSSKHKFAPSIDLLRRCGPENTACDRQLFVITTPALEYQARPGCSLLLLSSPHKKNPNTITPSHPPHRVISETGSRLGILGGGKMTSKSC